MDLINWWSFPILYGIQKFGKILNLTRNAQYANDQTEFSKNI